MWSSANASYNSLMHLSSFPLPLTHTQIVIYGLSALNIFTLLKIKHYTATVSLNLHKHSTMPLIQTHSRTLDLPPHAHKHTHSLKTLSFFV